MIELSVTTAMDGGGSIGKMADVAKSMIIFIHGVAVATGTVELLHRDDQR